MKLRTVLTVVIAAVCLPVVVSGTALGSEPRAARGPGRTPAAASPTGSLYLESLSCPSAGNCVGAGESDVDGPAFVVNERNGRWFNAIGEPGVGAPTTVSCGSAGNCVAVGGGSVVAEQNGRWGKAMAIPGLAALGGGSVNTVSCSAAGDCVAGGSYVPSSDSNGEAWLVSESNGHWGKAFEVPGIAALNNAPVASGNNAEVTVVSCPSPGNCSAGGYYTNTRGPTLFVVSEGDGHWGKAHQVPGTGITGDGVWYMEAMSCPSAGNCAAAGFNGAGWSYVVNQSNERWGKALFASNTSLIDTVSCASAGNCLAAGSSPNGVNEAWVVAEQNGSWGSATEVPGMDGISTVSCNAPGNCVAGGYDSGQAFVVGERNGSWGKAIEVPGTGALNTGDAAGVTAVSCPPTGNCAAGGTYASAGYTLTFVVNENDNRWEKAINDPHPSGSR
jgi:hypothetical protein